MIQREGEIRREGERERDSKRERGERFEERRDLPTHPLLSQKASPNLGMSAFAAFPEATPVTEYQLSCTFPLKLCGEVCVCGCLESSRQCFLV